MDHFEVRTASEQVADYLREQIKGRIWVGEMPGTPALAKELGVHRKTIENALKNLENSGILQSRGMGRSRSILLSSVGQGSRRIRIAILRYGPDDFKNHFMVDLKHKLREAGHIVDVPSKSLVDLKMSVASVSRLVRRTEADAWLVVNGPKDVLQWFCTQSKPTFALFGRMRRLPLAGADPDKLPAYREIARRLVALGHRRIVYLARKDEMAAEVSLLERGFLDELEAHGIEIGPYHSPAWKNNEDGFHRCLDSLFRATPPTALLIEQPILFAAAQQYLAHRGILAPGQISMVCSALDPTFEWCRPSVAHLRWESSPLVRRAVRWADGLAKGRDDRRQVYTNAEFVDGDTMGPAPK